MAWDIDLGSYNLGDETAIEALSVVANKRISQHPIIRSHVTEIPDGKLKPLQIKIKGKISGSTYAALRVALEGLRNAVYNGKQNFELDTDRYARVVSSNFGWSFITKTIVKYNVTFLAELPFWLANTPDSDDRFPTSGVGYTINNGGQVRVPCKIEIIAPAGGISDDIQFENTSLGLLFKYRGALAEAKTLVVDMGFDTHNKHNFKVENDGVSDMANFEGDFAEATPGDNIFKFTGPTSTQIKIYFRKGYYN